MTLTTTNLTPAAIVYSQPTRPSTYQRTDQSASKSAPIPQSEQIGTAVVWAQARFDEPATEQYPLPDGFSDIDDFIDELSTDPEISAELAKGRIELAGAAYEPGELLPSTLRMRAGLSQRALAKLVLTSQSCLAKFEKGDTDPQLSTFERYANALGVPTDTVIQAFRNARKRQTP